MTERIFNFSAGPAMLPLSVIERARDEMLSFRGAGMSVMEMSHRSKIFKDVLEQAETRLRRLMSVPDNYSILFLQGGATLQFSMVPINFLGADETADYIITGAWGTKAMKEAQRCGGVRVLYSSEQAGFRTVPDPKELNPNPMARYIHYTSNETIEGVEFPYDLDGAGIPVVCDASSNILSKPFEIEKYSLIYAGAQKNIGPSGVTVVIISDELIERVPLGQHKMLDYRLFVENDSMPNTPNTWGIYLIDLVCEWLIEQGGLKTIALKNREKASILYNAIDSSDGFYTGHAETGARSLMNVTFRLTSEKLEEQFCSEAAARGMEDLKGHRSVGGIRASIYNAFPLNGVETLIDFMDDFAGSHR
ncbi:3-phosphoserine/phosphohydroxythreonine transaminase [soil metagenome]